MVGLERLELSTSRLSGVRSKPPELQALVPVGGGKQNRTVDI